MHLTKYEEFNFIVKFDNGFSLISQEYVISVKGRSCAFLIHYMLEIRDPFTRL